MTAATVLVVDDRSVKRYLIGTWLRRAGYQVVEAESGAECFVRLADGGVDAVILDVNLPDQSGYEVCERIKSDPRWSVLPVLHISAIAVDVTDRTQGLTRGADAYLAEPIEPDELIATLYAMLRYYGARRRAERLARRLAGLAETTLAVNSATTAEQVLSAAAQGAAAIFQSAAAAAAQALDGRRLVATVREPASPIRWREWYSSLPGSTVTAAAPGTVVRLKLSPDMAVLEPWNNRFDEIYVAVAQPQPNRQPVYISVATPVNEDEDEDILTQLGQAVAQAMEALRSLDEERRIALTLQRSLLPRRIPTVPGYDIVVRYEPATAHVEVGGDFYELARYRDWLVVAIGDVAGHSLHAATVMAELRHALRAYVAEGHGPTEVLRRLNDLMLDLIPDEIASVCVALLAPETGELRMANAGHMPPLLIGDGRVEPQTVTGPMLGVPASRPDDVVLTLPPGGTLLLYTDGLIERRGEPIDVGLATLVEAVRAIEPDLDAFATRLMASIAEGVDDDIAFLALRRHGPRRR